MRRVNLHRAAYHSVMALRAQPVTRALGATDLFAVRAPGEPWPLIVSISNEAGEPELLLTRGPAALQQVMSLACGTASDAVVADLDVIACSFCRAEDVRGPARQFLRRAGVRFRPSAVVPAPHARSAGEPWRPLRAHETQDLFVTTRGMLLSIERRLLTPEATRRVEGLLTLTLSGDPLDPDLTVGWGEGSGGVLTARAEVQPVMCDDRRLSRLPRLDQTWLVGCPIAPFSLEGTYDVARVLVVLDRRSLRLVDGSAVSGPRWAFAAASRLFDVMAGACGFAGRAGVPADVRTTDRELARLLCPSLRTLGATCGHDPTAEGPITTAFEAFLEELERRAELEEPS
jgi:hypothetical protein